MGRWTLKWVNDAMAAFFCQAKKSGKARFPRFKPMSRWRTFGPLEATGLRHEGDRTRIVLGSPAPPRSGAKVR